MTHMASSSETGKCPKHACLQPGDLCRSGVPALQASRPVNAASFLRDPYRGDDFERTSSQGMRSDARYGSQARGKPGGYGDLMDDPARDDRYQPRVSGAVYAKPSSRSQHVY